MPSRAWKLHALAGTLLIFICGCQTHRPYNYGQPGVYTTPPGGYPSSPGTYAPVQPGTPVQPGGPTLGQPAVPHGDDAGPWYQPESSIPQAGPQGSGSFGANKSGGHLPAEQPVPQYDDPNQIDDPPADGNLDAPFKSGSTGPSGAGFGSVDDAGANGALAKRDAAERSLEPAGFEEPVPFQPASAVRQVSAEEAAGDDAAPNPYDYDRKEYRWLRGKVDYDAQTKDWQIIYSLVPDKDDPYGGSLTLLADPKLNVLKTGDVVLVEGRVDGTVRDERTGRPAYRIDQVFGPLVPKP